MDEFKYRLAENNKLSPSRHVVSGGDHVMGHVMASRTFYCAK